MLNLQIAGNNGYKLDVVRSVFRKQLNKQAIKQVDTSSQARYMKQWILES